MDNIQVTVSLDALVKLRDLVISYKTTLDDCNRMLRECREELARAKERVSGLEDQISEMTEVGK